MTRSWSADPQERPSFERITRYIQKMLTKTEGTDMCANMSQSLYTCCACVNAAPPFERITRYIQKMLTKTEGTETYMQT